MIRFSCVCNQMFEAPEDRAGTSFQCPHCGRLVDVPTLSELDSIGSDGTYKIDADPEQRTPEEQLRRVAELKRVFTRNRTDEYGREIDLRPTMDDVKNAGADEVPLDAHDEIRPGAPKYDPITGELIRPLDVKADEVPSDAAIWTGPPVDYAHQDALPFTAARIMPELLRVPNMAVMFGILCLHLVIQLMLFPLSLGFLLLVPFYLVIICGLFAHDANIVEDVGPGGSDELPRPMRDLSWGEDVFFPFGRFMLALICSYGIAITAIYLPANVRPPALVLCAFLGSLVFPAVLLTTLTSGTISNMRPDRVISVMRACGATYPLLIGGWVLVAALYLIAFITTCLTFLSFFRATAGIIFNFRIPGWSTGATHAIYTNPLLTYPLLILAIFFMHAYAWFLGLQYRNHHHEFLWVLQSHVRDPKLPPKRGFEIEKRRPKRRYVDPVQAQPVIPVDENQTPGAAADVAVPREKLLRDLEETLRRQAQNKPKPPDDKFDIDELLKP